MSHILVFSAVAGLILPHWETKFEISALLGLNARDGALGLPRAFGLTTLILSGMSFWILIYGFLVVNGARKKYSELAKKDGEKDVDERFGLPNLYAQGTSKHALAFNCVQRSHQQIFETFPQMCLLSMVGAVHYPIATALLLSAYAVGRYALSTGYASADNGDANQRYSHPLARFMWYGYITMIVVATVSSISFLVGKPLL